MQTANYRLFRHISCYFNPCQPEKFEKWETLLGVDLFFSFFLVFVLDFIHLFNTITLHHRQELPTLLTYDIDSGRKKREI